MKTQITNLFVAMLNIVLIVIAGVYKFVRRCYRRFCIKVLWKHFRIRTSVYYQWHDKRAKKLQVLLDNECSIYPTF